MIGPSSQCWQPMLAIDIGPIIDRGLDDNCETVLAFVIVAPKSLPMIGRESLPIKPMIVQIYNDINNDNKI